MEKLKIVKDKVVAFLLSKDMKALYWSSGTMLAAGTMDLILQQLLAWDANNLITIAVGLIFARITKKLNSQK